MFDQVFAIFRELHEKTLADGTPILHDDGPPTRPVCDVTDGVSRRFSYLLSNILAEVCYGDTVCGSTEEMLASIKSANDQGIEEGHVVGSMDVKALYPSLDVEETARIVCEEFRKMETEVVGVDYEELGLYLALCVEREELERIGIGDICPTRANSARKPEITASGIQKQKNKRFEPWIVARSPPSEEDQETSNLYRVISCLDSLREHRFLPVYSGGFRLQFVG